jgi:TPR repeat protein
LYLLSGAFSYADNFSDTKALAEQGDADAQNDLGVMYDNGNGVPQDHAEAAKWFRKAAERGLARAQYNLGIMREIGKGRGGDWPLFLSPS